MYRSEGKTIGIRVRGEGERVKLMVIEDSRRVLIDLMRTRVGERIDRRYPHLYLLRQNDQLQEIIILTEGKSGQADVVVQITVKEHQKDQRKEEDREVEIKGE